MAEFGVRDFRSDTEYNSAYILAEWLGISWFSRELNSGSGLGLGTINVGPGQQVAPDAPLAR